MSTLVVYFSQTGKTKELAEQIAQISGGDLAEIKTEKSYEMSYRQTVFTSMKEILTKARPALAMDVPDCQEYDRILIGCPIWCGTVPNAVRTFLDQAELKNKQTAFFTTSGATEPKKLAVKMKKYYPDARWRKPLNGNNATEEDIKSWLGV
ncbi:MAG: flavodoxin [Lachnospiraceae bacterium]|nr:flavodoxin [Lachnospiraceae bacterium]